MGYWRLPKIGLQTAAGTVAATANASANTKGAWAQIFAATQYPGFLTFTMNSASLNYSYLFDIGIGADGSEVVIAGNLIFEWSTSYGVAVSGAVGLPIFIPAGARVSYRAQCSTASSKVLIGGFNLIHISSFYGSDIYSIMETYGANTADSGGTSVDPGASAQTWGSWVQFSASCTRNIKAIMFGAAGQLNFFRSDYYHFLRLGVGAEGSEQVVTGYHNLRSHMTTNMVTPQFSEIFPVSIPAGSRLAVQAYCNGNDASDRLTDCIVYAFS